MTTTKNTKTFSAPSAAEFLGAIYGRGWANRVWTCGFANFPGNWTGAMGAAHLKRIPVDRGNFYFCIGELAAGSGRRGNGQVIRQRIIVADDVGTKASRDDWARLLDAGFPAPTFRIETSPGNETWGWVLDKPVEHTDVAGWSAVALLRAHMGDKGLTDPGVADPARYIRLPVGWNSKPGYLASADAVPPSVKLLDWEPGRRTSLHDMGCSLLGREDWRAVPLPVAPQSAAQLGAGGALVRCADMNNPEPIMLLAQEIGMNPVQTREGVVEAICPNVAAHTADGREETGFAFLGNGLMECHHGPCQHLNTLGFRQMMIERFDAMVAGQIALGMEPVATDAGEFLAREELRRQGALGATAEAEAQAVAADMAARQAGAAAQAESAQETALAMLAYRFAWLAEQGLFFDTKFRKFYTRELFNAHADVTRVVPVGSTGLKAAANVILNRKDRRDVAGITFKPGDFRPVVEAVDATGRVVPHANTWSASDVGVRRGVEPKKWLEVVNHLVPDKTYREFLIDWMAWVVQNPASRTPVVPVVISGQGSGKDTVLNPFLSVVGVHNTEQLTSDRLMGRFNEWLCKRVLVLTEVRLDAGGRAYNRLKALTGAGGNIRVSVDEKNKRAYEIEFVGVFIAMTNEREALRGMEHDDRRLAPYVSPAKRLDTIWSAADHTLLSSQAELERLHGYLLDRNVSKFNPFQPPADTSGARQEVLTESLSAPARAVHDVVTDGVFKGREVVSFSEVLQHVQSSDPSPLVRNHLNHMNARQGLLAAGCLPCHDGRAVRVGERRERLYVGTHVDQARRDALMTAAPKHLSRVFCRDLAAAAKPYEELMVE